LNRLDEDVGCCQCHVLLLPRLRACRRSRMKRAACGHPQSTCRTPAVLARHGKRRNCGEDSASPVPLNAGPPARRTNDLHGKNARSRRNDAGASDETRRAFRRFARAARAGMCVAPMRGERPRQRRRMS
jgi:hypothetical protein